jgi:hypothetical protein
VLVIALLLELAGVAVGSCGVVLTDLLLRILAEVIVWIHVCMVVVLVSLLMQHLLLLLLKSLVALARLVELRRVELL